MIGVNLKNLEVEETIFEIFYGCTNKKHVLQS
jgi:hypothetical protein